MIMRSSYKNEDISYGQVLKLITILLNPKKIVEIGILDGYSLKIFADNSYASIEAYDIFEDFNGNHADYDKLVTNFKHYKNVKINYGDFYKIHENFSEIDIIHIDIANNGDVYQYAFDNYYDKLRSGGVLILEGGSIERDNVEWMKKFNKTSINSILKENAIILGKMPSLTVLKKD